jgi:hypothetical protein
MIKIAPIIEQAQLIDVKPLLGDRFYFDLINNLLTEKYQPLLDGCAFILFWYTMHDGIKALLADYFMAKYVLSKVLILVHLVTNKATTRW